MTALPTPPKALNPLWIIFLFFSFAEVTLGGITSFTTGGIQVALTCFVIFFPTLVSTAFFLLLWFRPEHLYAPRDFLNDEAYLRNLAEGRNSRNRQIQAFANELDRVVRGVLATPEVAERLNKSKDKDMVSALNREATRISYDIKHSSFITVDFSSISEKLSPLSLLISAIPTMNDLTDEVYFALSPYVKPYAYGYEWILRDTKTGQILTSLRMNRNLPPGKPCPDERPLSEVGVTPGMVLKAELIDKNNTSIITSAQSLLRRNRSGYRV